MVVMKAEKLEIRTNDGDFQIFEKDTHLFICEFWITTTDPELNRKRIEYIESFVKKHNEEIK